MKNTFTELLNDWLAYKSVYVKESTYSIYVTNIQNHIIPILGEVLCEQLCEEIIQDAILDLLSAGRLDKKGGLSEQTVRSILMIIKMTINWGMKKNIIPRIRVEIKIPTCTKVKRVKVFSRISQNKLIESVNTELNNKTLGIIICLHTGIRIGELCALKWSDLDFENKVLSITKTVQRISQHNITGKNTTRIVYSSPKTLSSIRQIPISTFLLKSLNFIKPDKSNTYILTNSERVLEPRSYRRFFDNFLTRNNIDRLNFHCLRHTFATRCIEIGTDPKTLCEILGHSNVNITMNLYVHPSIDQKRKCIEQLNYK